MNSRKFWCARTRTLGLAAGCMLAMGLCSLDANAATLPFTFTPGATAKASDVNANFQAINNALPTFLGSAAMTPATSTALTATAQNIVTFTGSAPTLGTATITASGTACGILIANAAQGPTVILQILVDGTTVGLNRQMFSFPSPGTLAGNVCVPFGYTGVVSGLNPGPHVFALQASMPSGTGSIADVTLHGIVYH